MTHSVADVTCSKCSHIFSSVLHGVFNISKTYVAICPSCSNEIFFNPGTGIVDFIVPEGAVTIKCAGEENI